MSYGKWIMRANLTLELYARSLSCVDPRFLYQNGWRICNRNERMSICCMLKVKNVNFFLDETKSFFMAKLNENSVT